MIKNQHQYDITKTWIKKFQQSIISLENNREKQKNDPEGWKILHQSYQSQLTNLQEEIAEYQTIVNHDINDPLSFQIKNLTDIGKILIKARIAFNITPLTLARLTGLTEQTIISYEDREYQNASFADILIISDILGITIYQGIVNAKLDNYSQETLNLPRLDKQEKILSLTS